MVKVSDIILCFLNEMPTPEVAFKLLTAYCKKSGRNFWEEFGYTFAGSGIAKTIIILRREGNKLYPLGFCNLQFDSDDNSLFLNQGHLLKPVDDPAKLLEKIYDKMTEECCIHSAQLVIHSDLPERLWRRFGFKRSKWVIYEREMETKDLKTKIGGNNNG